MPVYQLRCKTENVYIYMIQLGEKRVGSPKKDAFELHCLRVDYQAKYWLNANNVQMDVVTATDTGGWKLGGGPVAPIGCEDCLFLTLFCNALLICSILSRFATILTRKRELVVRL